MRPTEWSEGHLGDREANCSPTIFCHIPSTAYVKVAPKAKSEIRKPCVGSINKEEVAPQAAEWGMMDALAKRPSVKVRQSVVQITNLIHHCSGA